MRLDRAPMLLGVAAISLAACGREQSVLVPLGDEASRIGHLTQLLLFGGAAILALVVALLAAAVFLPDRYRKVLSGDSAILYGGVAFPAIVLTALLLFGVMTTAGLRQTHESAFRISVEGKQWWWRIRYEGIVERTIESANEIRIPVGQPVQFTLSTGDVIHSFWVPNLAGKLDMIPGRITKLQTVANVAGEMRGQCAEFCGGPHGLMSLRVIAMPPAEFAQWIRARAATVRDKASPGHNLFNAAGCGACHTIDGTLARGTIGPNLTDVGSRRAIAAETLPMSRDNLVRWITHNQSIKPENLMPQFSNLTEAELSLLSTYLEQLK